MLTMYIKFQIKFRNVFRIPLSMKEPFIIHNCNAILFF